MTIDYGQWGVRINGKQLPNRLNVKNRTIIEWRHVLCMCCVSAYLKLWHHIWPPSPQRCSSPHRCTVPSRTRWQTRFLFSRRAPEHEHFHHDAQELRPWAMWGMEEDVRQLHTPGPAAYWGSLSSQLARHHSLLWWEALLGQNRKKKHLKNKQKRTSDLFQPDFFLAHPGFPSIKDFSKWNSLPTIYSCLTLVMGATNV